MEQKANESNKEIATNVEGQPVKPELTPEVKPAPTPEVKEPKEESKKKEKKEEKQAKWPVSSPK